MTSRNYSPEEVMQIYLKQASESFMSFLGGLFVPSGSGPRLLSKCMAEHQRECFQDMAPSLEALRDGKMPPKRRWWIERTKKASKDTDIAAAVMWLLAFSTRPMFLQVGAADRAQAAIIKRRIEDFLFYNEWLTKFIQITAYRIQSLHINTELEIVAADISGSHGATPDLLICNELSHVTKWEFIQNMMANADGVPQGMLVVATNAGFKGSEAAKLREVAINSKNWTCHIYDKPAPWISPADLADAEARDSKSRFRRLWYGEWSSGLGDAFDVDTIDRCIDESRAPTLKPEKGWFYIAGLDLGIKHDHSGVVVVGINPNYDKLRLAYMRAFIPGRSGEVNLMEVEDALYSLYQNYHLIWVGYDPHQCALMAQRLRAKAVPMREVPFVGKNLNVMASTLMEVMRDGKLEAYDDEDGRLRSDLSKFSIVEKSYGFKLESTRDASGHADVGTALAICLPFAMEAMKGRTLLSTDELIFDDGEPLTEEEVDEMPIELREIFDFYDRQQEKKFDFFRGE